MINDHFYLNFLDDFQRAKLGMILKEFSDSEPPFLIHCVEGKDRTGFVAFLLECLTGASADEMGSDYADSFANYYHIPKDSRLYEEISSRAVQGFMEMIQGDELHTDSYKTAAVKYLYDCGLTVGEIVRIKDKLVGDYKKE